MLTVTTDDRAGDPLSRAWTVREYRDTLERSQVIRVLRSKHNAKSVTLEIYCCYLLGLKGEQ